MSRIDKFLENESEKYLNIEIPNEINEKVKNGIEKGKNTRRKNRISKLTTIAASLILVLFISLVRVNPAFASFVSDLPYMDKIVELINGDKSLEKAIENDYMQYIGNYDEHEGLRITVESIIMDESSMFVFYSIEGNNRYKYVNLHDIDLIDEYGENIEAAYSYGSLTHKDLSEEKILYSDLSVNFSEDYEIPDKIFLSTKIKERKISEDNDYNILDSTWNIEIPIDKEKFKNLKEEYIINKDIVIDNHKITVEKLTIYPTRVSVDISSDENNSTEFFGLYNLRLIDENNEEFASIKNGITASGKPNNSGKIFYLDSSYFSKPESLTLKFDGIRILDKNKKYVEINLEKKEMVSNTLEGITFESVKYIDDEINIIFKVFRQKDEPTRGMFSHSFLDSEGNEYNAESTFSSTAEDENYYEIGFVIEKDINYQGNIILEILDYPGITEKEISIKIK